MTESYVNDKGADKNKIENCMFFGNLTILLLNPKGWSLLDYLNLGNLKNLHFLIHATFFPFHHMGETAECR